MGKLGDLSPGGSIAVGIIVGLASTSVQSVGLTMQRKSHILEDEKAAHISRRPPYRRRRWQVGMLMFIISNLGGSTIQITTLPLPVLSTLQASGLVFNSICASLLLSEPFTRWSLVGTVLVTIGAVLIATFGAIAEPAHSLDQLLALLREPGFLVWFIFTFVFIALILISSRALRFLLSSRPALRRLIRGISYGSVSGILSAHSLLVAKSAVELLVRSFTTANQFNRVESWLLLLLLLSLALSQLYFLHRGLKLVSTSVLYPLVFGVYNIIAILDGLIYFRQASRLGPLDAGLVALGTVILLSGVAALSWRLEPESSSSPEDGKPDMKSPEPAPLTVAPSALAPGLGLVDDVLTDSSSPSDSEDEGRATPDPERQPLLSSITKKRKRRHHRTSTQQHDAILAQTRPARMRAAAAAQETAEILGELRDESSSATSPLRSRRRASTLGLGLGLGPKGVVWGTHNHNHHLDGAGSRSASPLVRFRDHDGAVEEVDEEDDEIRGPGRNGPLGRAATVGGGRRRMDSPRQWEERQRRRRRRRTASGRGPDGERRRASIAAGTVDNEAGEGGGDRRRRGSLATTGARWLREMFGRNQGQEDGRGGDG